MADKLGYSKVTVGDIVSQIVNRMNADPKFQTFRESSSAKMLIDQFAGMTDMLSYYLERRAEESFLETAKLKSSIITASKQLGYVVQRPIPANASISITLQGNDTAWLDVLENDVIQIPAYASFTFGGNKFLVKNTYIYTLTKEDVDNLKGSAEYSKTIQYGLFNNEYNYNLYSSADLVEESDLITMDIIQAEKKYHFIAGVDNNQLGRIFQVYNIPDNSFSNLYGSSDYPNHTTKVATSHYENNVFDPSGGFTGSLTNLEYVVDRRSIMQTDKPVDTLTQNKICLIRTNPNESVDLVFGDGVYSDIGAKESQENISIQYLSTLGGKANQVGVVGSDISYDDEIYTSISHINIKSQIKFKLTTNINGGADLEDINSIKLNAPAIYYSLDRCVTVGDYIAFLNTLTSPINVKNAIAWGEQEEGNGVPLIKLFNIALFSCFGSMYDYNSSRAMWNVKQSDTGVGGDMFNSVLDAIDIFGGGSKDGQVIPDNHYFYMVVNDDSPGAARTSQLAETPSTKLGIVYDKLKSRSQVTVRNVYVSPIIQEYDLDGKIFINSLVNADDVKTKIQNAIYQYLDNNANYNVAIRLSNLVDIIETFEGVLYCNVKLIPTSIIERDVIGVKGESVKDAVKRDSSVVQWIESFVTGNIALTGTIADTIDNIWKSDVTSDVTKQLDYFKELNADIDLDKKYFITEQWFWKTFVKKCYDALIANDVYIIENELNSYFSGSKYFDQLMMKFKNLFSYTIRYNLMTDANKVKGDDIAKYTLRVELPKVTFKAGVIYK